MRPVGMGMVVVTRRTLPWIFETLLMLALAHCDIDHVLKSAPGEGTGVSQRDSSNSMCSQSHVINASEAAAETCDETKDQS
jgi:hypothetical protein